MNQREIRYYLCSEEVVKHFSELEKSEPFKSGYDSDDDLYYVIATKNFKEISDYHDKIIEPYNEVSRLPLNFFLREVCESTLDASNITLRLCKQVGIFKAVEQVLNLTKETNIAFAIYGLTIKYSCMTPIELINKVVK